MDALTRCVFVVSLLSCFLNKDLVEGVRKLSKEEDFELEKQLKLINQPAIKTIQTKYGQIYDCIDFYKQPAFDHPLLKNHTFHYQMRPSSQPKVAEKKELTMKNKYERKIKITSTESCPIGTVPIRRITKDDLIRFKLHSERFTSNYNIPTHYAVVRTKDDPKIKYNGGSTFLTVYNPSVKDSQYYSSSRMKIQNGQDSIEVGWMVNPTLYGNNVTHIFTQVKAAGKASCFGTVCPFVVVSSEIHIDVPLKPVSERGGQQYAYLYSVYRDPQTGHWWLELGDNHTKVGYWPYETFTDLKDKATRIDWGGEVSGYADVPSPQMGSGYFIKGDSNYDAFCGGLSTINDAYEVIDEPNALEDADISSTYEVASVRRRDQYLGYYALIGGPGGFTGN